MTKIILLLIGFSSLLLSDLVKSGDVVLDSKTHLMWQDNIDTKTVTKTWIDAINYCEALTLEGYNDWRLPNIIELKSIADETKSNPAIDSVFENTVLANYWSSSTLIVDYYTDTAWSVDFNTGVDYWHEKSKKYNIRCVRIGE